MYWSIDFLINFMFGGNYFSDKIVFYSLVVTIAILLFILAYFVIAFFLLLTLKKSNLLLKTGKTYFEFFYRREFVKSISMLILCSYLLIELIFINSNVSTGWDYFWISYSLIFIGSIYAIYKAVIFMRRKNYLNELNKFVNSK